MVRCMGIITKGARHEDIMKCQVCGLLPDDGEAGWKQENDKRNVWVVNPKAPCNKCEPK